MTPTKKAATEYETVVTDVTTAVIDVAPETVDAAIEASLAATLADEPEAADEPVVESDEVAAAIEALQSAEPDPAYDGETFVIGSNTGRTVVTVSFSADVTSPDAEGRPVVVRTGEGLITIVRDGQTVLAHPLMREAPLE